PRRYAQNCLDVGEWAARRGRFCWQIDDALLAPIGIRWQSSCFSQGNATGTELLEALRLVPDILEILCRVDHFARALSIHRTLFGVPADRLHGNCLA